VAGGRRSWKLQCQCMESVPRNRFKLDYGTSVQLLFLGNVDDANDGLL
jgi:hypothetical protein